MELFFTSGAAITLLSCCRKKMFLWLWQAIKTLDCFPPQIRKKRTLLVFHCEGFPHIGGLFGVKNGQFFLNTKPPLGKLSPHFGQTRTPDNFAGDNFGRTGPPDNFQKELLKKNPEDNFSRTGPLENLLVPPPELPGGSQLHRLGGLGRCRVKKFVVVVVVVG